MTKGIYSAIVTPFREDFSIDWKSYEKLIEIQVASGIAGIVVTGTTGESPTLTHEEKTKLWEVTLGLLKGTKLEAIAGTGTNNTAETIELTQKAGKLGYQKFLLVTPYYNKPTQAGLLLHYRKIADSCDGEIVLYNVPGRTGVSFTAETIASLSQHPKITALKEATGNLEFLKEIQSALQKQNSKMDLLSGDDATTLEFLKKGGVGCISVASIVAPGLMVKMGDRKDDSVHQKLSPLFGDLFIESNPGPVKYLLSQMGLIKNVLRLPLAPVSKETEVRLKQTLALYQNKDGQLL